MIRNILFAGLLLCGAMSASAGGLPEELGRIDRFESVTKEVIIDGRRYQVRGEALQVLSAYREQNGIGSLVGKKVVFRAFQDGGTYYIDLVQM